MARSHSALLSIGFFCTLLRSVYAFDSGADLFEEQEKAPVCQVFTLVESPIVIETLVPSNTVLSISACDCEITITNAPTLLTTTVTATQTLGHNAFLSPPGNPWSPAGTNSPNIPSNLEIPKFYIIVTEVQNNKRQTTPGPTYLRPDGGLTSDASQGVQIYEWLGQLFTMNGAPNGTYFADVTVETITLASQPTSSLTSDSIAGHFSLGDGKELLWENESFTNSHAIFALSPEGMVTAIFNGKHPPNVKVVALVVTRVANQPAFSDPGGRSSTTTATATSTGNAHLTTRQSSSFGRETTSKSVTPKVLPVISNTKLAFPGGTSSSSSTTVTHSTSAILTPVSTPIPTSGPAFSSSCATFTDTSDGGLPMTLGLGTLASPPNWPFSYTLNDTTFVTTFGTQTSAGSLAYAEIDPRVSPGDSILYYQLNPSTAQTSVCETWGYLYHQQSGLCLTATPNITTPNFLGKYEGGHVALEPCIICTGNSGMPQADQLFCAVQENGALEKWFCMKYMEDIVEGLEYGVLYQEGVVPTVLEEGSGDCIYVAAL